MRDSPASAPAEPADPLAEAVALLAPAPRHNKRVAAAGRWRVQRDDPGQSFYGLILAGEVELSAAGGAPVALGAGDFVLVPSARGVSAGSPGATDDDSMMPVPVEGLEGGVRLGRQHGPAEVEMLVGYCAFAAPDAALLVSLMPPLVVVREEGRLAALVRLISDEARAERPARGLVLERLLELLFIEAMRAGARPSDPPGLARGLADPRLAAALRRMHEAPAHPWTVAALAAEAALSRSAFFSRFRQTLGVSPMGYLLNWRMALARDLLRRRACRNMAEFAGRVGYASAAAFSNAFTRHAGAPPSAWLGNGTTPG